MITLHITQAQSTNSTTFDLNSTEFNMDAIFCPRPNIEFDVNKANLRPSSFPLLDSIVIFLKKHPRLMIEVQGHTDSDGSNMMSWNPSQRRAQSVVNYLVIHGIYKTRFRAQGCGEERPLVPNTSKENKAFNRRIVFRIMEIKKEVEEGVCPICEKKDEVVKVVYGKPSRQLMKRAKKGEVHLGGCVVSEDAPRHYCKRDQHEFK